MSSYFDTASAMFAEAMRSKPEAEVEKIVATVVDTYGSYLAYISKRLAKESRPAFEVLKERWIRIIARPLVDDWTATRSVASSSRTCTTSRTTWDARGSSTSAPGRTSWIIPTTGTSR